MHCPDCLARLRKRPRNKQDGRCATCRSVLMTKDDRRKAKAEKRKVEAEAKLADAHA